jgi:hypothetical protein
MSNSNLGLSYNARKALSVHVGEAAGNEIANLIQRMAAQIEELKRSKVNVTPIVPGLNRDRSYDHVSAAVESETF